MKTILVATDLSDRSDRAILRALRLAAANGAECHVLYVSDNSLPEDLAAPLLAAAEGRLRRHLDDAAPEGAKALAKAVSGDPVATICDAAADLGADLVVLGTHRARPFLDALRETSMERLVRMLRQPVLLVRNPADHDYRKVLVPVSFSAACAAALRAAEVVAPGSGVTAFHAIHVPFAGMTGEGPDSATARQMIGEAERSRVAWARAEALPAKASAVEIVTGGLTQTLERKLQATGADLIALGAHTRGRFVASSLGSFAAGLIRHPPADLLIARPAR